MKWYADITRLTEHDMSEFKLKLMRFLTIISLPFAPLLGIWQLQLFHNVLPEWLLGLLVIVTAIPLFLVCISRLVNRVWVRDKYLDEWELRVKHRSMAFGFQVVLYVVAILGGIGIVADMIGFKVPAFPPASIGYGLFALLMLGMYAQIFAQFSMIEPIDEDDLAPAEPSRRPIKGAVMSVIAIFTLLFLPPFLLGVVHGYNSAHAEALCRDEIQAKGQDFGEGDIEACLTRRLED